MRYVNPILLLASAAVVTAQDAVVGQNLAANSGSCASQSYVALMPLGTWSDKYLQGRRYMRQRHEGYTPEMH
jgi:hypothetical protein